MQETGTKTNSHNFTVHQKLVVLLLAITQFTIVLDFMVLSPLGDTLMKALLITPQQFGLVVSAYAFSAGFAGFLTAGFADRFDRKSLLLFFYVGFILGTLLCALANSYQFLLIARIVTGLFGGVIGSISMTIITDLFSLEMRGRAMGVIHTGFSASQVLGIPVGLYLANMWGWQAPFQMIVILSVIMAFCIIFFLEPIRTHITQSKTRNIWQHYSRIIGNSKYRLGFLTTALVSIGGFLMQPFGAPYLVNNLQVSHTQLPVIFLFTGIASLIFMPLMGKFSDQMNKFTLYSIGTLWATVFLVIYVNLPILPLWIIIAVNILLFVGILARMIPAMAMMTAVPEPEDRGGFMSINASLQQIAGGIAAAFGGMIVIQETTASPVKNYDMLGYIGIGIMLFSSYLQYKIFLTIQKKSH